MQGTENRTGNSPDSACTWFSSAIGAVAVTDIGLHDPRGHKCPPYGTRYRLTVAKTRARSIIGRAHNVPMKTTGNQHEHSRLVCTIGHSNRPIEEFIALLRENGVA